MSPSSLLSLIPALLRLGRRVHHFLWRTLTVASVIGMTCIALIPASARAEGAELILDAAVEARELDHLPDDVAQRMAMWRTDPSILKVHLVHINARAFDSPVVHVKFRKLVDLTLVKRDMPPGTPDSITWVGSPGPHTSSSVFAINGSSVEGSVSANGVTFAISPIQASVHALFEFNP